MTQRVERRDMIEELLVDVRHTLERHPESAERRTLLATLRRFEVVVARWNAVPPSKDQLSAMLDVLHSLQEDGRAGL